LEPVIARDRVFPDGPEQADVETDEDAGQTPGFL
jgi:hypothetical protein